VFRRTITIEEPSPTIEKHFEFDVSNTVAALEIGHCHDALKAIRHPARVHFHKESDLKPTIGD
jgi:hypothetical protein